MDINGVLAAIHDPANRQINTTIVNATAKPPDGSRDPNWVLDHVYDKATNTVRVVMVP